MWSNRGLGRFPKPLLNVVQSFAFAWCEWCLLTEEGNESYMGLRFGCGFCGRDIYALPKNKTQLSCTRSLNLEKLAKPSEEEEEGGGGGGGGKTQAKENHHICLPQLQGKVVCVQSLLSKKGLFPRWTLHSSQLARTLGSRSWKKTTAQTSQGVCLLLGL